MILSGSRFVAAIVAFFFFGCAAASACNPGEFQCQGGYRYVCKCWTTTGCQYEFAGGYCHHDDCWRALGRKFQPVEQTRPPGEFGVQQLWHSRRRRSPVRGTDKHRCALSWRPALRKCHMVLSANRLTAAIAALLLLGCSAVSACNPGDRVCQGGHLIYMQMLVWRSLLLRACGGLPS